MYNGLIVQLLFLLVLGAALIVYLYGLKILHGVDMSVDVE